MNPLETLDNNRRLCVGVGYEPNTAMPSTATVSSEAEFNELVGRCYQLWREQLADDVGFLTSAARTLSSLADHKTIAEFAATINKLRTASSHSDAPDCVEFRKLWMDEHRSWAEAGIQIYSELATAIEALVHISTKVRGNPALKFAWQERVSIEPSTVVLSVARDLGITLIDRIRAAVVAQVKRRWRSLRPGDDPRERLEQIALQELITRPRWLPVPYHEVLDRLNLIGSHEAKAAMMVAYGVAETSRLGGEQFLDQVERVWNLIR